MNQRIKALLIMLLAFTTHWVQAQDVAKIGSTGYATLADAVAAADVGATIEVVAAGNYTLPNLPKNVTIEGKADGVVSFTHTTAGNVASVPNGATFKNVKFIWGNVDYHGFQHAGTINMEGCTLDGKLFSYGDMNFTNCSFTQSASDYHMWTYAGNVTYTGCTFTNSATGKFINVYNESGATKYTVTATNCTFINNASSNKAALNVKATCGSKLLAYDVIINNCSTEGSFPGASSSNTLVVLNSLVQVDDRPASGADNITVTQDGVLTYPVAVAVIGETRFETLDAAVTAANTGDIIEVIAAGNYTLPNLPKNVTIEGKADGDVSFTHTTAGNVASVPNGATFKNVKFIWGNVDYHGFQHAGTINMEGCTLDGKLFSYGDMNFTNCSFTQSASDYHMWTYAGNVTYTGCTFTNSATGKFINVYNESGATKYTVTATNCTFINNASSNKAALNVKATCGSTLLAYDVIINNCSTEGSFPGASSTDALVVLNSLVQVDDRPASGVDNITVTQDGVLIYPVVVAQIGSTGYATLQAAVNAAQQMGGAQTINIVDDISEATVTIKEVANFKLTIDGQKDASSNYTVDATIVVDGLRGNGGSTTNGASVTLQNIAFVKTTSTDGIQASHYPHHLTIQDCTYSGSDNDKWFLNASVDGPLYGVTVKNVTVEHARLIYANMAEDAVFENITATNDAKVGFNVKTSGTALIKDCQVTTAKYAFRDYSDGYEGTFTLEGNTFVSTSEASDEGVIVNRGGVVGTTHVNVESGTYTGHVKVLNNKEGVLAISGGYFSEEFPQEYIAADLVAQGKVCVPATDKEGFFTIGDPHYVAQIGSTGYATLQAAVDAAQQMGGAQTINIVDDISEATVTIKEVANFKLTIDGQKDASSNYTVDATIVVDGLRGNGGSTTNGASVTLQNIAFVKTTSTDGIQASHYPHHLTIQDCTYSGSDNDKWFLNASVDGPLYGVTVKNVTVEHARLIYANMAEDAVFENITATNDAKVGFNVKTSGTALIKDCQVTTAKYAFRDYSDGYEGTFTLEGNTFVSTSEASDEGVIVNRGGVVGTTHVNVESGTYTGHVKVLNNKEGVLAISGGYFSEEFPQEYIAEDLVAQGKVCAPATDKEGYFTVGDPHYVAKIGETQYVSLAKALEAVPTDGAETTIVMIDDETINSNAGVTIPAGKNVVLDLNGKTIKGVVQSPTSAQTILNRGTLVITDNSSEKNGTITNEVSDENAGSPGNEKNWFSNAISNNGTLTVNNGNIVNTGTGGACYAIDNQTNGTLYSPVLNIAGGNISAKKVAVRMFCNSTTNVNTVNMTGGAVVSEGAYGIQTQQANTGANKAALSISGGSISGQYAWVDYGNQNVSTQFDNATYSITGGFFSGGLWSYATYYCGMEGFISGGYFSNAVGGDLVATGCASVDNTDEATMANYPYTIGLADVYYYWLNVSGQIDGGGYYTIYAPFSGPDPVLMDGEFVVLQKDVTLTKDIEYIEEVSFGDPIFKGGTFTLTFGEYNIDLNGHVFPIPTGVTILTDKQTDIFSALEEDYKVVEETTAAGYSYSVVQKTYVAQIDDVKYESLQAALDAAHEMTGDVTIELLDNISGYSIVHQKAGVNITIDGADKTVAGQIIVDGDGRASGTETLTIQNVKFEGNTVDFLSGTDAFVLIPSTKDANKPYTTGKYNYAHNVTVKDCSFTSTSSSLNVVGVKATSGAGLYNVVLSNDTGTNLHSLAQLTGTTGGTIENNTVTQSESFLNVNGGAGEFSVSGNQFTSAEGAEGYGVRENGSSTATINLTGNTFTATNPIVLGKGGSATNGTINVADGIYTGTIKKDIAESATGKIAISSGYFSEEFPQEYIAADLVAQGKACVPATDKEGYFTVGDPHYVAKIGETKYVTLQAALDAAHEMTGDVTIELLDNISGYSIVHQKAGVNITIDGADKTVAGQIIVDGDGRASGTETLTIQNVKFEGNTVDFLSGTDAFVLIPSTKDANKPYTTGKYNYAHNVTVKDCSFTSTSSSLNVVGVKATSGAGLYNVVLSNDTGTNLHSLAQLTGTTGGTIENNTVTQSESFLNVNGGAGEFSVSGNQFTSAEGAEGYGVRENGSSTATINLTGNTFTATNPIVLGKGGSATNGTINVADGIYTGTIKKDIAESATGKIVVSGGYFSEVVPEEYIVEGKICVTATDKPGYYTIKTGQFVAQIGTTKYESLADAIAAVGDGETITMLCDVDNAAGLSVPEGKNFTVDFAGYTYTLNKPGAGSTGTETIGFQLLKNSTIIFKNGTINISEDNLTEAVAPAKNIKRIIQNYANLTLEDMTIDGTNQYGNKTLVVSFNNGTSNIIGNTSITAGETGVSPIMDVYLNSSYTGTNVTINTTGVIGGDIETCCNVSQEKADACSLTITNADVLGTIVNNGTYDIPVSVSGGIYDEEVLEEFCAEGYVCVPTDDGRFTVKTKEDAGIFDLVDWENYPYTEEKQATQLTYSRRFNPSSNGTSRVGKYQPWIVPFDYEISEEDAENFQFYKINLIASSKQEGEVSNDQQIYINVLKVDAGYVLKANRPYIVVPLHEFSEEPYVFKTQNVTLKVPDTETSQLHTETARLAFDFYANYKITKFGNIRNETNKNFCLSTSGTLMWLKPSTSINGYRWYAHVTDKYGDSGDDYSNWTFVIGEDDPTGIYTFTGVDPNEIEGIYTPSGMKVETPVKGINIIKFTNGTTKKVYIK